MFFDYSGGGSVVLEAITAFPDFTYTPLGTNVGPTETTVGGGGASVIILGGNNFPPPFPG